MEKIKRFFECFVPVTACNLKCGYCYVIQRGNRSMDIPQLKYTVSQIGKALSKERLGGVCYFSLCGAGETLMADQIIEIVEEILRQGHYVNITSNGTLTKQFERLVSFPEDYINRLHIAFSFHYLELLRIHKLDDFFNNIKRIKNHGGSFVVQLNLCDEYEPYFEEIKVLCEKQLGALPQLVATRKENDLSRDIEYFTSHLPEEYVAIGSQFNSPLFDYTIKNFNVNRKEFCYAGDWGGYWTWGQVF